MKKNLALNTLLPFAIGGSLAMIMCTFVPSIRAASEASTATAPDSSVLRVGVSPAFPPMVFKQGSELAGVEVDLARALGTTLGRRIQFVEVPWEDQIEALNARKTDIIMSSMSVTSARRFVVNFSQPYLAVGQMVLVRREDTQRYALGIPLGLKGPVGVIKATTGEFLVQRDFPKAKRKSFSSGEEAAKALSKKKIELFISDSSLVWYLGGIHSAEGLSVLPIVLTEEQLAWAMRKGDDALLASVNAFIDESKQDGALLKVFRRWTAVGN
jgi:polar amino acid transport system substrate-binding protein